MRYSSLLTRCPDTRSADMAGMTTGICGVSYGRYNYIMKQLHGMQRYSLALPRSFMQRRAMATILSTNDVAPVTVSKIKKVLKDNAVGFDEGYTCLKITCPICQHDPSIAEVHKSLSPTAFINVRTGLFTCYNCHVVTSWRNLQDCFAIEKTPELRERLAADCHAFPNEQEARDLQSLYESSTRLADTESSLLQQIISRFGLQVLPLFEQFDKITLWFGNRLQDWESVKVFARKLSEKRCYYVRPKEGYPLAALQAKPQSRLPDVLKRCQPVSHRAITTFHSLRAAVADLLQNVDTFMGVPWQRFPGLVRLLKGFRTGELTVFTGPTGSGKTTFMCEYSLDLCMQGVNTLWGSFEIQNEKLGQNYANPVCQCEESHAKSCDSPILFRMSLENNMEEFDSWADKFELLPLYFMTFHGEESMKNVMDAMAHAVYVHDIQHVVVDNVQFMMGVGMDNSNVDRFWRQDLLIASFRRFATQHNCHVTLVMHPRKEKDSEELSTSSIFGGAKASQEADNVLILQDRRLASPHGRKHLQLGVYEHSEMWLHVQLVEFERSDYIGWFFRSVGFQLGALPTALTSK
ncbi:hypothetical protein HPB51_017143 [Rhipicephalus microplus]|uniref:SF4 helicase domain-containing protein n=1 Tax=Rhipicephalus microplus TaxID=6941 RepID=A0A9J6DWG9_RHIMP|nr:hypothetical protein HPB51_017143 [Rhipicephalus microplus]